MLWKKSHFLHCQRHVIGIKHIFLCMIAATMLAGIAKVKMKETCKCIWAHKEARCLLTGAGAAATLNWWPFYALNTPYNLSLAHGLLCFTFILTDILWLPKCDKRKLQSLSTLLFLSYSLSFSLTVWSVRVLSCSISR